MPLETDTFDFAGACVTVMGLGRGGETVPLVRWLAAQGAQVTLTDMAPAEQLADPLARLADVPIARYRLGGHSMDDFANVDALLVHPSVRPNNRWLEEAAGSGCLMATELELLLNQSPARMIGVAGTHGKSTTAAMVAACLRAAGRRVWTRTTERSLLDDLPSMASGDWVVLTFSSRELAWLSPNTALPQIAVVTNCTPERLDWHRTWEDYVESQQRLLVCRRCNDTVVLAPGDAELARWRRHTFRQIIEPWDDGRLPTPLALPGLHNRRNAACAAAAAALAGCAPEEIVQPLSQFAGLPGRLQTVGRCREVAFVDDSQAATPVATLAALTTINTPVWLLAGGCDDQQARNSLSDAATMHAQGVAWFGPAAPALHQQLQSIDPQTPSAAGDSLEEAFAWCAARATPGDTILLSPGLSQHGAPCNAQQLAARFAVLVRQLAN